MATNKKSFVLYTDIIHTFEALDNDEAGRLIKHLLRYVNDQDPETNDKIIKIAFEPIKQQLKRDLKIWEGKIEKRSLAGKASALKRNSKATKPDLISKEDSELKGVKNWFRIAKVTYKLPVSEFIVSHMPSFLETWQMQNKEVSNEAVLNQMDKSYCGTDFNDEKHIQNAFRKTFKELNTRRGYNKNTPSEKTTISKPKPFQREF